MAEFSTEEWEEILEEIPKKDDPFLQKYFQGREALIEEENRQRSDHSFRQNLSPIARRADAIVARIRAEEKRAVWTASLEDSLARSPAATNLFPGMMFGQAKARMETTRLWRIVRRLPKGALLHAHLDAMVDFGSVVAELLATPGMHLLAPSGPLGTAAARRDAPLQFRFLRAEAGAEGASLWREGGAYAAGEPVLLTRAADAFPDGGRDGFVRWLRGRCTISREDAAEQHHGVDHVWRKFTACFAVIGTIIHYEPIFRSFVRRMMSLLWADGISWVEIRFVWTLNYYREGSETPEPDFNHRLQVLDEEVRRFQASDEGRGFWGLRCIWTSMRRWETRPLARSMDGCLATKLAFPHLVAGYDVVGQEDAGRPLRDLVPELAWFRKQCAAEGVTVPFFFHAGECLGTGDETDHNLFDAVLLGTRRLGHAFSLYKHPLLVALVRERRILVESCPISNEVLRLTGSVLSHPLPALLARGVACALCNDDPAILGQDTAGSTHDFWQALQGWESLGLAGLGSLAENSVRWAAFEDQTADEWAADVRGASLGDTVKAERLRRWRVEWEKFCLWVVDEYGDEYGDEAE